MSASPTVFTESGVYRVLRQRRAAAAGVPAVKLTGVTKKFGERNVLDALDLKIGKGESLVVLGKSGTGKSVLLKHIIGLLRPDAGTVEINGTDLWGLDDVGRDGQRKIYGMSFQEGALFDSMTVAENIAFPLRRHARGLTQAQIDGRVKECLDVVRLPGIGGKRPSELSGGMRRRVGFARAIAHKPEILLFDEPTTGLDPITTDAIVKIVRDLDMTLNPTMVTITHDLKVAWAIADRVALLQDGKILLDCPPEEFQASTDPHVVAFVNGDSDVEEGEAGSA